jgi:hypothetical protein
VDTRWCTQICGGYKRSTNDSAKANSRSLTASANYAAGIRDDNVKKRQIQKQNQDKGKSSLPVVAGEIPCSFGVFCFSLLRCHPERGCFSPTRDLPFGCLASLFRFISRDICSQIIPRGIILLDKRDFLLAPPAFNLLFSPDGCFDVTVSFVMHQTMYAVLRREPRHVSFSMLLNSLANVVCYAGVKRPRAASENVNAVSAIHRRPVGA